LKSLLRFPFCLVESHPKPEGADVTVQANAQTNASLLFFVLFLLIIAAGRGKFVWNSLSAKEKKLRLAVLGIAIVAAIYF
jgi:hypothetical protein